jgi:hypothetical protein
MATEAWNFCFVLTSRSELELFRSDKLNENWYRRICFVTWVDLNNLLIMAYSFTLNDSLFTAEVARWPVTNVWSRWSYIRIGFGVKVTFGVCMFLKYVPIYWYWLVLHPRRLIKKKCWFRINSLKFEAWSLVETSVKIATVDGGKVEGDRKRRGHVLWHSR